MPSMPGSIFLVAVLFVPTQAEALEGKKKTVVVEPAFVLADDAQGAINKAILKADRNLDPDRFEVLVTNPF